MTTRTITARTKAWFSSASDGPEDLQGDPLHAVNTLSFYGSDMRNMGWTLVGEADITVHVVDEQELVANKVDALRAEKSKTLADAQMKATEIDSKIQKLLAITNEGQA